MKYIWVLIASISSGVVAGMGMGGGTVLIPVLTIFFGTQQQIAQGINLFAFLPTAFVSLLIHIKNKLVDFKKGLAVVLSGVVFSVIGSLLATKLNNHILRVLFGVFLLLIGVFQISTMVYQKYKQKKEKIQLQSYHIVIGTHHDLTKK